MGIQRIDYFLNQIKTASDEAIEGVCLNEVDYLRQNYNTITATRTALTDYRNAVKKAIIDEVLRDRVCRGLKLTNDEALEAKLTEEKNLSGRLKTVRPIKDIDGFIEKGNELLDSSSYLSLVLGIAALTGRRVSEVACTAKFTRIEGRDDAVMFDGQIKVKGREDVGAYEIPVLGDPDRLINALAKIREAKPMFINDPDRFHNAASKELNKQIKKHFEFISDGALSPKDLRAIYAEIVYLFSDVQTIAKPKFFSMMLGHTEDDNKTGVSYLGFYVADEGYQ